ncbi:MAG: hypothetical protein H6658_09955 [Ardenticatenaceae bacterium]|nr:hypothetical protein [Ardenticatenaceae bacterium]
MKKRLIWLITPLILLTLVSQVWAIPSPPEPEWHLVEHTVSAKQPIVQVGDVVTIFWAVMADNIVNDGRFFFAFTTQTGDILLDASHPLTFPTPEMGIRYHFQCGQNDPTHEVRCMGIDYEPDSTVVVVKFETEITACLEGSVTSLGNVVRLVNGQFQYEPIDSLTFPCLNSD